MLATTLAILTSMQGTSPAGDAPFSARRNPALAGGFLDNRDRWPQEPYFVGAASGVRIGVLPDGFLLELQDSCEEMRSVVSLGFEGASAEPSIEPAVPLEGLHNSFIGDDPSRWRRNVRAYGEVIYRGLYPGIDLRMYGGEHGFEYDLLVSPYAELDRVVVRCEGMRGMRIDPAGGLALETELGTLVQPLGRCWQEELDGSLTELHAAYRRIDDRRFGFTVEGRDPGLALNIDPELVWSTYLGGPGIGPSNVEEAFAVALDEDGNVTVVGTTEGGREGFPMTPGTFQAPSADASDCFVTRFRQSDGTLVYSSLVGGYSNDDRAYAVAVDSAGRATVAGRTSSPDFPTTPGAWDTVKNGLNVAAFVLRLSAQGDDLEYGTFLEGSVSGTQAFAVAATNAGNAIVGGFTSTATFPTTSGAFDTTFGGFTDAFLTRFDPTGSSLEWSTFLGGSRDDQVFAMTVDPSGDLVATGPTWSMDFPTTPAAFSTSIPGFLGNTQAFVVRMTPDGSALVWSTFLGGATTKDDIGRALAILPGGDVIVAGDTDSPDFPTTPGVFQPTFMTPMPFGADGFVTRFDSTGSRLVFSTYLGSPNGDAIRGLAVTPSGVATLAGFTDSGLFPATPGAFDTTKGMGLGPDGFVARLDPSGSRLFYSSFVGSRIDDGFDGLAMDATGRVTLVGGSTGSEYPTTPNALQRTYAGGQEDAVVTTMDLVLQGVAITGPSRPACLGPIQLNATTMPLEGASNFGFYCSAAPPQTTGWLVLGPFEPPVLTSLSPDSLMQAPPIAVIPVQSDAGGYLEVDVPLAPGTRGMHFIARCIFKNPTTCPGPASWSSSNGLRITVQ